MQLILGLFEILIIGKLLATVGLFYLTKSCFKNDNKLGFKEVFYIFWTNMMQGVVAFGLVLRLSGEFPDREVVVTTCVTLIVTTTILFAGTAGAMGRLLLA